MCIFICPPLPFCFLLPATTAADDCPTLRTLFGEVYLSGKRVGYGDPYDWLETYGYGVYIPQCLQNGSFATVQCSNVSLPINTTALPYYYSSSPRSRYCWCVDPATGIATTNVYRYDTVPSPEECPYFNTTTLCQVREYVSVCRSVLCMEKICIHHLCLLVVTDISRMMLELVNGQ